MSRLQIMIQRWLTLNLEQPFPSLLKPMAWRLKGVTIAQSMADAKKALSDCFVDQVFKEAGHCVVIEDFLEGSLNICIYGWAHRVANDFRARSQGHF